MPLLSLARPIENIATPDEAKVLAVIDHLMPVLADWRKAEDLRVQVAMVDQSLQQEQPRLKLKRQEMATSKAEREKVPAFSFGKTPVGIMVMGLLLGGAVAITSSVFAGIAIGVGLAVVGLLLAVSASSRKKKNQTELIEATERDIAELDSRVTVAQDQKEELGKELARRAGSFPEVRIADVRFGLQSREIAGHNALLDASGVHPEIRLKTVNVTQLRDGLSSISEQVNALLDVPPLLTPGLQASPSDPVHALFGEESRLQDLVGEFTLNLGKLRDVTLKLPLVPSSSVLVQRLAAGDLGAAFTGTSLDLHENADEASQIQSFVAEVNGTKESGQRVFSELSAVYQNLERACSLYARARTTSVNTIHQNLVDVLNRASWCSRRFYCPRTVMSPAYLQDLLDIEPARAFLLPFDELHSRLQADQEIAKRLTLRPELEDQLLYAYNAVQDFMGDVAFDESGRVIDGGRRPKHIEEQFQEALRHFSAALQKVLTGATYPVLNFSPEAQLFFDPEGEEWSSNVSPYVYSTADAMKYGGMVKAYSDLMIPLWEHLWTEKADFRKSELFRTNESMIRMSEKESEKLIDIANEFRADMRTVREHINLIEPDLKSKYDEIVSFRDGMDALGLLSDRARESISNEKLQAIVLTGGSMAGADRYETLLSTMPQAQAENRGAVRDPIDLVREPGALLGLQAGASIRLLAE